MIDDILSIIKDKLESYNYICDVLVGCCLVSVYINAKIPLCYIKYTGVDEKFVIISRNEDIKILINDQIIDKIIEAVNELKIAYALL